MSVLYSTEKNTILKKSRKVFMVSTFFCALPGNQYKRSVLLARAFWVKHSCLRCCIFVYVCERVSGRCTSTFWTYIGSIWSKSLVITAGSAMCLFLKFLCLCPSPFQRAVRVCCSVVHWIYMQASARPLRIKVPGTLKDDNSLCQCHSEGLTALCFIGCPDIAHILPHPTDHSQLRLFGCRIGG